MDFSNSCDGFYNNSIDVRFTNRCDNNCPFCIEKGGLSYQGLDVEAMINNTINLSFDRVFKSKKTRDTVLILGGEPLLNLTEVREYVSEIRPYFKYIYLTTSLPKTILEDYDTFIDIFTMLDGLNVSLQHYDSDINNDIMASSSRHDRIKLLQKIALLENATKETTKIRVSINLVKGCIDSKEKLNAFLDTMRSIGIKHVKINELQNTPDLYVSFENIYGYKLKSPYSNGCQKEISLSGYPDIKITLKRSCFVTEPSLNATFKDMIKAITKRVRRKHYGSQFVIYENGKISRGWIKQK